MSRSDLLSLDNAIKKIKSYFNEINSEEVFLENAIGRCLAEPIISKLDNPRYDVSSMDGYAIDFDSYTKNKKNLVKNMVYLSV